MNTKTNGEELASSRSVGFIDCHCHVADPQFDEDIDQIVSQAKDDNVKAIIVVPEFFNQFQKVLNLCNRYPEFLFPCLGIHPVQKSETCGERGAIPSDLMGSIEFIESHIQNLVGIGEVGLDFTPFYTKEEDSKELQRIVFKQQIDLAKKYDLPLNVHSRSAGRPVIKALMENSVSRAVLHAYSGNAKSAMEGARAGYYFSIPPCIVRSEQKQSVVKALPIDRILLETDSPALGPEKLVRNVPSNITFSCDCIAKIKGISCEEVMRITTENALRAFPRLGNMLSAAASETSG